MFSLSVICRKKGEGNKISAYLRLWVRYFWYLVIGLKSSHYLFTIASRQKQLVDDLVRQTDHSLFFDAMKRVINHKEI